MWKLLRDLLEGEGGKVYTSQFKLADLPRFPGTVVGVEATEYLVSIVNGKTVDVVVRLTGQWKGTPLAVGTELEFQGKAVGFTRDPFRLTIAVDPAKLEVFAESQREKGTICQCYSGDDLQRIRAGEKVAPR